MYMGRTSQSLHANPPREWRTRLASDGDYQPRAASSAAPDDCSSPVFVEYSQHAAQGMHEALQAAMYMQVVNGWSTFAEVGHIHVRLYHRVFWRVKWCV